MKLATILAFEIWRWMLAFCLLLYAAELVYGIVLDTAKGWRGGDE